MGNLNEIISELKTKFTSDTDLSTFCTATYGSEVAVKTGEERALDIPLKDMPVVIVSDGHDEREKKRFLFSDKEANLVITCGIVQNDTQKASEELITFKELIKGAIKKDPLLNGKATYSTVVKSRRLKVIVHPLYFMELTLYVNYKN